MHCCRWCIWVLLVIKLSSNYSKNTVGISSFMSSRISYNMHIFVVLSEFHGEMLSLSFQCWINLKPLWGDLVDIFLDIRPSKFVVIKIFRRSRLPSVSVSVRDMKSAWKNYFTFLYFKLKSYSEIRRHCMRRPNGLLISIILLRETWSVKKLKFSNCIYRLHTCITYKI